MNPAWVDEDDEKAEAIVEFPSTVGRQPLLKRTRQSPVNNLDESTPEVHRKRLRERYQLSSVYGKTPKWAQIEPAEPSLDEREEDGLQSLVGSAGNIIATKAKLLPAINLKYSLLRDPTISYQNGNVTDIKFHPSKPVLVTATTTGRISLFQLCQDVKSPALKRSDFFLQSVSLPNFRIQSMAFYNEGNSLLASASNWNFCYTYDLLDGSIAQVKRPIALNSWRPRKVRLSADGTFVAYLANKGDVYIFVLKTMDHLHTFRAAGTLVDFCFSPVDREVIYAQAEIGGIHIWNLRRRAEQDMFFDHGCVRATCIECSANGQFMACGSNTGIVNVYDLSEWYRQGQSQSPSPDRTFDQLTTSISWLHFNRDSQMLAMGSDVKKMAARLGHCSTGTVFANFPTKQEHLSANKNKLISAAFSPNSAFLAIGTNEEGTRLYRLNHYDHY